MSYAITIYIADDGALSATVDADFQAPEAGGDDRMELQSVEQITQLVRAVQAEATGQETESPTEDQAEPQGIEPEQEDEDADMQAGFQGVRGAGLGR